MLRIKKAWKMNKHDTVFYMILFVAVYLVSLVIVGIDLSNPSDYLPIVFIAAILGTIMINIYARKRRLL